MSKQKMIEKNLEIQGLIQEAHYTENRSAIKEEERSRLNKKLTKVTFLSFSELKDMSLYAEKAHCISNAAKEKYPHHSNHCKISAHQE